MKSGAGFRRHGVLIYRQREPCGAAVILTLIKSRLAAITGGDFTSPAVEVSGDGAALESLTSALEPGNPAFNIVTP
ncbi:alkyl sulfatase C-terminal domain-containing protein [Nesterenkonia haasae]|uniref:alkyl sulfatase C-terminal domain-containing protein n=1 Tax=Nesterenkonia haasae TaxID=2587813 RepID=UPI00192EBC56|nr:alkyl sulfatase C-terminal domain-containing protein [Nesterenkonia haasae]